MIESEKNPLYTIEERPRGFTAVYTKLSSLKRHVILLGLAGLITALCTMGLVILGNEITKEMWVSSNGIIIANEPVATHQSVTSIDFDHMLLDGDFVDTLNTMKYITLELPDSVSKYAIEWWSASESRNTFEVHTTDNHTLGFNGTHLDWDDNTIAEVVEEEDDNARKLQGLGKFKKFVKKKLDSPMCNTEALIDKFRDLKIVTAAACHVGVNGAKIYMHYRDN